MSTRSPIQIYTTCVSSKEYGWALWRPEPSEDLPWAYRLRGVRPGDVGYVDQRGGFVYMFNITCGADAAVNLGRVPHNLTPFDGVPDILRVRNIHPPGAVIASDSFRTVAGSLDLSWKGKPAGISTSCSFQSTTREGGLLVLPDGADSEDLMNYDDFVDYAILHAPSWYEHANNVLRRNIGTDSLYLVTGCDKAETWALAAHSGTGTQTDLSLRLDTTSAAGGGVSYSYRWEHQHSVQGRVSSNILHIKNQCVFARGLRVSVRSGPRSLPRSVKVESPVGQFLAPPKFKGTEKRNGGPVSRLFSRFKSNLSTPRPQNRANSAEMVVSIEPISERLLSYNPGAIINKYLLEQNPAARVAVTHDSDYHCVLQEGENLPLTDSELIRRVLDRFQVVINSDGVSLVSKTSRSSPNPKRFDSPMVTFMKIPDSRSSRPVSLSCARIQPFSSSNVISQDVPVPSVIPVFSPSDRGSFRSICTAMVSIGNGTSSPPTLHHSAEAASRIGVSPQSLHFSGVAHANGSARVLWHEPGSMENPFMRSLRSRNISNSTPTSVESTLSGYHIPSTPLLEHQRSSQFSAINAFVVSWRPSSLDVALSTWKCSHLIRIVVSERIALALSLKFLEGDPGLHNAFFGGHLAFVPPDHLFGRLIRCVDEASVFPDELRDDIQHRVIRLIDHCLLQNKHVILSEDLLTKIHDFFSRVEAYSPDEVVLHKASTNLPPPLPRSSCISATYQPPSPTPLELFLNSAFVIYIYWLHVVILVLISRLIHKDKNWEALDASVVLFNGTINAMAIELRDSASQHVSFSRGISFGLLLDGMAGLASSLAAVVILVLISRRIHKDKNWEALNASVIALLGAEVVQAIWHMLTIKWATKGRACTGTFCTVQDTLELYHLAARMTIAPLVVFQQLGGPSVALTTLNIAVQTFLIIWRLKPLSRKITIVVTLVEALYLILSIAIVSGVHTHPPNEYFGPYWCWIGEGFPRERIALAYFWFWFTSFGSILLYIPLFLLHLDVIPTDTTGEQWYRPRADLVCLQHQARNGHIYPRDAAEPRAALPNDGAAAISRANFKLISYPIHYSILVVPLSVVRFIGFHQEAVFGKSHTPDAPIFFFVVLMALSGVWNALLYRLTRASIFQKSTGGGPESRAKRIHGHP